MTKFIFDLDGTITAQETLPLIHTELHSKPDLNRKSRLGLPAQQHELCNALIATRYHKPAKSILSITDYPVFSEEALCRQLNQLL